MRKQRKWLISFLIGSMMTVITYGSENPSMTEGQFINGLQQRGINCQEVEDMNSTLTREETATYLVKALGLSNVAKGYSEQKVFTDVVSHRGEINLIKNLGLMNGTGNTTFGPNLELSVTAAENVLDSLDKVLKSEMQFEHAFYAISSSSQMSLIKNYDAISFGWAELVMDEKKAFSVVTDGKGDFKIPSGFEQPLDEAKANNVATYLMVYYEDKGGNIANLLNDQGQRGNLINQLVQLTKNTEKDGVARSFDGLTIDFEQLRSAGLKLPYVNFLKELKQALAAEGKGLMIAVQPTTYFKGYDYKGIGEVVDRMILMTHDYGAKSLNETEQKAGKVMTPMTPINEVYKTLLEATNAVQDKSKLVIQISFSTIQWQTQNNQVLNAKAYTPTYAQVEARLSTPGTQVCYDEVSQNTYATYETEGVKNIIWYEDQRSIEAKENIAKLLGIQGISYWRLGTIPNSYLSNINLY